MRWLKKQPMSGSRRESENPCVAECKTERPEQRRQLEKPLLQRLPLRTSLDRRTLHLLVPWLLEVHLKMLDLLQLQGLLPMSFLRACLVHNVTTYVGTKSGRAFHLEHCTVVRHRTHDVDRWDLCSKCFPVTPIRFPKGKGVMCLGNLMHSDGHCHNLRNIDMFGKDTYKVPCQSCISTIEH